MQIQGYRLAYGWAALAVSLTIMNAMGVSAAVGVELAVTGGGVEQVESVSDDLNNPDVEAVGDSDPGFFGVATSLTRTLEQLGALLTSLGKSLKTWGVPGPIADGIQIVVDLSFGAAIVQTLRGVRL